MTQLKPTICAVLLTITVSSTALAGNIPTRTGNIPTRTGNIPTRTGNIPTRTGNIPTRTGVVPTRNADGQFDFSENLGRLVRLLLESGVLF